LIFHRARHKLASLRLHQAPDFSAHFGMYHCDGWPTTRVTLLARIRNGADASAWQTFVDLYTPVILSYCRKRGLQHADSQDIAQEVFGRVSRAIQTFEYDPQRGPFRRWLGLITHQQMLRYRQRQARAGPASWTGCDSASDVFEGEAEGAWIEAFNAHIYACALEGIRLEFDAEAWRAFQRVWDGDERPGDVAREMHKDPQWIYQVKHRIVTRLKQEIERLTSDSALYNRP
jgi:RNA polymerase sigma-70 factor (ECF subfamily)